MTWLERQVRNTSLRQFGACGFILLLAAGLLSVNSRYLSNVFQGAYNMSEDELLSIDSPKDLARYWINVKPDRVVPTGAYVYERRKITGRYYAALFGQRMLLVKAPQDWKSEQLTVNGGLVATDSSAIDRLALNAKMPDIRSAFLPVMLDPDDFSSSATPLLLVSVLGTVLALFYGAIAVKRYRNPAVHPVLRALAAEGGGSLRSLSASIEREIAQGREVLKLKWNVKLTGTHLLQCGGLKFRLQPLSQLLCAYGVTTTTLVYGIIPTSKSHSVALYFADEKVRLNTSKTKKAALMQHLASVAPWALLGHAPEIDKAYKRDRSSLVNFIAARRATFSSAASPGRTA